MTQPTLFTDPVGSTWDAEPPSVAGSATSIESAKQIEPAAGTLRRAVYEFIWGRAVLGATDEEIQDGLGMAQNTERPRRRELQLGGFIQDSGNTRTTRSGRKAVVWVPVRRDQP